jgi:hypothetical protein
MAHLVQRVSAFESQCQTLCKEKYLKGTAAMTDPYDADSDENDLEVTTAEWTWGKAPISCPWVKAEEITGKKYCKFHNVTNHNTNECKIFRFHIQKAIEQGRTSLS